MKRGKVMIEIGTYLVKGPGTPEERLQITKDAGFNFVCFGKSMFDGTGINPEMCARVGIGFDNIHLSGSGTTKIWSPGEEGDAIAERYCKEIQEATSYGVHTGIVHVTWGVKPVPDAPGNIGLARFAKIAECAEKYGFTVAIENSAYPEHLYKVLDNITSPAFGHCYDSGHRNAFAPREDFLGKYGDRLVATHMQDNEGKRDLHIMPFDGTIDWNTLAVQLAATELAQKRITAEFGGAGERSFPGMSAAEISNELSGIAIYGSDLLTVCDERALFYDKLSYEDLMSRLYFAMKRLADLIEAVPANA